MKIPAACLVVVLLTTPPCKAFLASRNVRSENNRHSQRLRMVLESPPELAEYRKKKLGESSAIDPDYVIDEARKRRRAVETTAKLEEEKTLNEQLQSTLSPEVAEYLQTKLGAVATIQQEAMQIKTDLSKIQSQSDETILSDVNAKVEFLAKKAEELTQRVQELKKTSLPQDLQPTQTVATSPLPVQDTQTTVPLSTALTVAVESTESQLALARKARLRQENAIQQRDEALRNQAESRRLAWEESKKRAEQKAKRKRLEPVVAKEAPKPQNKLDILARFEAWKEARVKSEDNKKAEKGGSGTSVNITDPEVKTKVSERQPVGETIPELDESTKARYEEWKRSKLEEAKKGTASSISGQISGSVETPSSSIPFPPSRPGASTVDARNDTTDGPSPRFDPRTRTLPKDSPTIMVKAVRKDGGFSSVSSTVPFESPSDPLPFDIPTMAFERPSTITEASDFRVERPFFLESPDDVFFLEIGEAAQMLHSVEAETKYQPQSRLYHGRIETPEPQSTGPSQSTSASWLGNLWRRLNRPDSSLPSDFVVRPSQGKAARIEKDRNLSTRITPSVPLEYAVRPTRPSQRIGSSVPAVRSTRKQGPTTPLEPPEFAVRPTRIQKSNSRMDQRNSKSPLVESPEFSVRETPSKPRNTPDTKPPYYARW